MPKKILLTPTFLLAGFLIIFIIYQLSIYVKKPLLIKGLPSNKVEAAAEFNRRVQNKLSTTSSSKELAQDLIKQGFSINYKNQSHIVAFYKTKNLVCTSSWQIYWKKTETDNIVNLDSFFQSGCF